MKTKFRLYLLLSSILLILSSCGTRKSVITTYKANVTLKEQTSLKVDSLAIEVGQVKEKEQTREVEKKDIEQKDIKTEVKEVFKDGKLTERTTTTTTSDKFDKSTKESTTSINNEKSSFKEVAKHINQTANKIVDSLIKGNSKNIDSNTTIVRNFGGWLPILVIITIGITGWYFFKRK